MSNNVSVWELTAENSTLCLEQTIFLATMPLQAEVVIMVAWLGLSFIGLIVVLPFIWVPVARGKYEWYTPRGKIPPALITRSQRWVQLAFASWVLAVMSQAAKGADLNLRYWQYCHINEGPLPGGDNGTDHSHHHRDLFHLDQNHPRHVGYHSPEDMANWEHAGAVPLHTIKGPFALSVVIWIFCVTEAVTFIRVFINVIFGYTRSRRFLRAWWLPPTIFFMILFAPILIAITCCFVPLAQRTKESARDLDEIDMSKIFSETPATMSRRVSTIRRDSLSRTPSKKGDGWTELDNITVHRIDEEVDHRVKEMA